MDVTVLGITVFWQPTMSLFVLVSMMALPLSRESKAGLSSATVICATAEHDPKTFSPIETTELGMLIDKRFEQPQKAQSPMAVTVLRIIVFWHPTTSVFVAVSMMALQLFRESYTVLPSATVICSMSGHEPKAFLPIKVTEDGISNDVREVDIKASYPMKATALPNATDASDEQFQNAVEPMVVTLFGNVMDARLEQKLNARSPMVSTVTGISTETRLWQA